MGEGALFCVFVAPQRKLENGREEGIYAGSTPKLLFSLFSGAPATVSVLLPVVFHHSGGDKGRNDANTEAQTHTKKTVRKVIERKRFDQKRKGITLDSIKARVERTGSSPSDIFFLYGGGAAVEVPVAVSPPVVLFFYEG